MLSGNRALLSRPAFPSRSPNPGAPRPAVASSNRVRMPALLGRVSGVSRFGFGFGGPVLTAIYPHGRAASARTHGRVLLGAC